VTYVCREPTNRSHPILRTWRQQHNIKRTWCQQDIMDIMSSARYQQLDAISSIPHIRKMLQQIEPWSPCVCVCVYVVCTRVFINICIRTTRRLQQTLYHEDAAANGATNSMCVCVRVKIYAYQERDVISSKPHIRKMLQQIEPWTPRRGFRMLKQLI